MVGKKYIIAIIIFSFLIVLSLLLKTTFPKLSSTMFIFGVAGEIIFGGKLILYLLKNK